MDWHDPETPWQSKLARAQVHLTSLGEQVDAFRQRNPYSVTAEPTKTPDRVAYRLHVHETLPTSISTTVGDLVHNLRSALDSLAYGMAEAHLGRALDEKETKASAFPVCETPAAFDKFFDKDRPIRATMYGPGERAAFRAVQPFSVREQVISHGVADSSTYEDEFRWDPLHRVVEVSNLDKHRRLVVMGWALDSVWWASDEESTTEWEGGLGRRSDGDILGQMSGTDPDLGYEVSLDFNLVLEDDPAHDPTYRAGRTSDVLRTLDQWYLSVMLTIRDVIHRL